MNPPPQFEQEDNSKPAGRPESSGPTAQRNHLFIRRILCEPVLHFLLIGVGLFVVYEWATRLEPQNDDNEIIVSAGRIQQLASVFGKTWQRTPTADELKGLIDDFVLEEIYYRKAVAMGIDRDDTIIRRRLRQKLEFLTDDVAAMVEPTEKELAEYLAAKANRFRQSPTYTFEQIYFNPDQHGSDAEAKVSQQLALLRAGEDVGDASLLPASFEQVGRQEVDGTFGAGFSELLDGLGFGDWQGPIRSGLGLHLVKVESRTTGKLPELAQIRNVVEREWKNEKRITTRQKMNNRFLEEYEVVIEWPNDSSESTSVGGDNHP